jgi:membrane protein YqaA with SNARE-associated domain
VEWLNVTAESGLWGLLAASFLSATVLPGGSEALLWGFLNFTPTNMAQRWL